MSKQKHTNSPRKRTFIYFFGRILIKSNIKLTKMQKKFICKTINVNLSHSFYGYERAITRQIFYELGDNISSVEFYQNRIGCCIKILTRK